MLDGTAKARRFFDSWALGDRAPSHLIGWSLKRLEDDVCPMPAPVADALRLPEGAPYRWGRIVAAREIIVRTLRKAAS